MYARLPALAFILSLLAGPSFGQAYLQVLDPQRWDTRQGSIDEAVLTIRPKGIYFEYGLYLTFSARNTGFAPNQLLEVALNFQLPVDAVVTDSWLWVEDEIIRAEIMDQWTASNIYEEIVNRQRDPSILFKRGPTQYELRVYPMQGKASRKVKITYLMPATFLEQRMSASLPVDIVKSSRSPLKLNVLTWPDGDWGPMSIPEAPEIAFSTITHEELGTIKEAIIPWATLSNSLSASVPAPVRDGLLLGHRRTNNGGYYQLALLPSSIFTTTVHRKLALLIDYDATKTTVSRTQVLAAAKNLLHTSLTPSDSFNVIISGLTVKRASDMWLPADSVLIERTFEAFGNEPISTYSNLPTLLANAFSFTKSRGGGGSLLLLSSSDQVGDADVANDLIRDLKATTAVLPAINILDVVTHNYTIHWIGGQYYEGNDYFYINLSRLTGGNYVRMRSGYSLGDGLRAVTSTLSGAISSFDLHTTLDQGFTFGRFSSVRGNEPVFLDRAVVQVGQYIGEPPFIIEASGMYRSAPFSKRISVPEERTVLSDTTLISYWTARQIDDLMSRPQTNDIIGQVISLSLDQRILSMYTAFLALEPGMGGEICGDCRDESDGATTDAEDEPHSTSESVLSAYPNPFNERVTVNVSLPGPVDGAGISIRIYNVMGQVVRHLAAPDGLQQEFVLGWDGTNDAGEPLSSGIYILVVTTPNGRHSIKLVLVR